MRFRVQQLVGTPDADQWEDRGWPEASGENAARDAIAEVGEETGTYRVRPADDDLATPALFRVPVDGPPEPIDAI